MFYLRDSKTFIVGSLVFVFLILTPSPVDAREPADLVESLTERLGSLDRSLKDIRRQATEEKWAGAKESLADSRRIFEEAEDIQNIAPERTKLLRSFLEGMKMATKNRNRDDLTALAQSAISTLDEVNNRLTDFAKNGTVVEVESANLPAEGSQRLALFVRNPPRGLAGFEVKVHYDPGVIEVEEPRLEVGKGTASINSDDAYLTFSGVTIDIASQRAPPAILALGSFQLTARGSAGTETKLKPEIVDLVNMDGDSLLALDVNGSVTIG